jgi:hypothetical protein
MAINQAAAEGALPYDVKLPADVDLEAWVHENLGRAPEAYGPPLMIPAADFNGDSQTSDYFLSFGSGVYQLTDGCHMAPAYLPHGGGTSTVTVNNFFVFALDNNAAADVTFNLWRKATQDTSSPTIMGTVQTTGQSTSVQTLGDTSILNPVVTSDYVYYITWCHTGTSEGVQGFWVFFTES